MVFTRYSLLPGGANGFKLINDPVNIEAARRLALRIVQKGLHEVGSRPGSLSTTAP